MRTHIFFWIFCIGIGTHPLMGSHGAESHSPLSPLSAPKYKTVFQNRDPAIIETNIKDFFRQNADSIHALEEKKDRETLFRIVSSRGNIASDIRASLDSSAIRAQLIQGFNTFVNSVWDQQPPYKPHSYATLRQFQQALRTMRTILFDLQTEMVSPTSDH